MVSGANIEDLKMGINIKPLSCRKDVCSSYRCSVNSINHYPLNTCIFFLSVCLFCGLEQSDILGEKVPRALFIEMKMSFHLFHPLFIGFFQIKTIYLMLVIC